MKKAFVIDKNIGLSEAAKIMSDKDISTLLFVSAEDKVEGILTERDLLRNFGKSKKVKEVMKDKIISIGPEEEVGRALEIMNQNKIRRLPVVEEGGLVGLMRMTDIAANSTDIEEDFFF